MKMVPSADFLSIGRCILVVWLLAASAQAVATTRKAPAGTPVVLISVDTLRADRLSCYGDRDHVTSNIDAFANGGTLFSGASALVPLTLPSHASLLTSTYPFCHGIKDNGEQLKRPLPTLASILKNRGYSTAAFVGGYVMDRRFGLNVGFDVYDSPFDLRQKEGKDPGDIKRLGSEVIKSATRWIAENSEQPFFVFLHLYDLHTPYNLPASYLARLKGLSGYQAEVAYVDDLLGGFREFLRKQNLFDRALIVFTSDHGEGLGDHRESAHGYFIYESTIHVPLIIRWPAGTASLPARVNAPVSLIDVGPTILHFLGLPRPPEFEGQSALRQLESDRAAARQEVYCESEYGYWHFGVSRLRSLRAGNYKYIDAPKPELYNLADDPGETVNLYSRQAPMAMALRHSLHSLRSRITAQTPAPPQQAPYPEVIERLRSLGYVGVSTTRAEGPTSSVDPKDRILEFEEYGRALMLSSFGRVNQANVILERLLAKFPALVDVAVCLGFNKQRQGLHAEAAELFQRVLKDNPVSAIAHFNLAVSYYAIRRTDQASRELQATLAIAPHYTRAQELLGTIAVEKGDLGSARRHFAEILKFVPDDYAAHLKLAVVATMQSQWDEAELHLKSAVKADPASWEAHNTLGSVYLYKMDLEQAAVEFAEALRLNPKVAGAHYNLGLVRAKQGRKADATAAFRAALSVDPKFQPARDALARLQSASQ